MANPADKKILVVGSINMDIVVRADEIPRPGQTIMGSDLINCPGGKGANQAVAVSKLGANCAMLGAVGSDGYGDQLLESLKKNGVDVSHVAQLSGVSSGAAVITVAASGENSIVVSGGANLSLSVADIEKSKTLFDQADIVLIQLEIPIDTSLAAIQMARKCDCTVILDPAPAVADLPAEIFNVDIISPNTSEAEIISSSPAGSLDAESAANLLISRGAKAAVMKLGAEGSLVVDPADGQTQIIKPFKVDVVDTTAAGDCFTGALAVGISRQMALAEAAQFANAAGALACTKLGAQPSAPALAEVENLIARYT